MTSFIPTNIPDVLLITPKIYQDDRGFFFESFNASKFKEAIGQDITFIQDNHSLSKQNVLRGLHYQRNTPQAKLIRVIKGEIFDVAVDLRQSSPTFLKWAGHILSADNNLQMFIPEGFAHGYLSLSESSEVLYKVNAPYCPSDERTIRWNDMTIAIQWPLTSTPLLSLKDANAPTYNISDCF